MTKIITVALAACLLAGCANHPADPAAQSASSAPAHQKKPSCAPQTGSHIADDSDCDSASSNPFLKRGEFAADRSGGGVLGYRGQTGQ
jgi:PBP1b-binding outer membrane lipoprotein LpoB